MKEEKIHTHIRVDLDAACSVWAFRKFAPGFEDARCEFHPAAWDGAELHDGDVAVDIPAGGRGIKGKQDEDGTVHSCFALILAQYAPESDQRALAPLMRYVDAQDAHGSAVNALVPGADPDARESLDAAGLNAVLRAIQALIPRDDGEVCRRLGEILDGILECRRANQRAAAEADMAEILPGGQVAIVRNAREFGTNGHLFDRGVRVIVYVDGHNLGVIRAGDEQLRMDHEEIRAVVARAGEEGQWFAHPAGFLYCRGSRKSPAETPSAVSPRQLAEAVAGLLS